MNLPITDVRIQLANTASNERILGFVSIEIDHSLVIRDLRIVRGKKGLIVAMPSRKIHDHCYRCRGRNFIEARWCNWCGVRLRDLRAVPGPDGTVRIHADIVFPADRTTRRAIESAILGAYRDALIGLDSWSNDIDNRTVESIYE